MTEQVREKQAQKLCFAWLKQKKKLSTKEKAIKLKEMTYEQLREVSLQRKSNGSFTSKALQAQRMLWDINHWGNSKKSTIDNGYVDKNIHDIDYNGW